MRDLNFNSMLRLTVFLVFAIGFFFVLIVGQNIIVPLVVAFFIAFLLMPLCKWLESKGLNRVLSALSSFLFTVLILGGVGFLFGSQIKRFGKDVDRISERISELNSALPESIREAIGELKVEDLYAYVEENIAEIFTSLAGFASSFTFVIVVPIYIVLILIYRDLFREFLVRVFSKSGGASPAKSQGATRGGEKRNIEQIIPRIKRIVQQYIIGMFYVICILFVLNSIALLSLGIEHALLFAAFAAVLNIIPFVGPLLGSTLPILFALVTKDSLFYPLAVLIAFVVIQTAESNLITPNIVGRNVSLNPLVTLITLFVGAAVWGVIGMVLFIPLVAVLKEVLANIEGLEPYAYVLGTGEKKKRSKSIWSRIEDRLVAIKDRFRR